MRLLAARDGLSSGRLDVLMLALPSGVSGVDEIPLYDEDFTLVVPTGNALAGQADVPREALRDLDVLLLDEGHCLRDQALDVCREVGASEAGATRAASLPTLVQLVAGGLGVTLLPATAIEVETRPGSQLEVARFAGSRTSGATTPIGSSMRTAWYSPTRRPISSGGSRLAARCSMATVRACFGFATSSTTEASRRSTSIPPRSETSKSTGRPSRPAASSPSCACARARMTERASTASVSGSTT